MSYHIIKTELAEMDSGTPRYRITAICDTAADVTSLGTGWAVGSVAIVKGGKPQVLFDSGWGDAHD